MKIKTPTEFISFSDGICTIFSEDDDGNRADKYKNLGFTKRTLGYKRFFEANANQMSIDKVIRIPQLRDIDTYDHVEHNGIQYDIVLTQDIYDSNPLSTDLTLQKR